MISRVEVANFCAVIHTLVDQDNIKVEVANFCAMVHTLVDQDDIKGGGSKLLCNGPHLGTSR